MAVISTIVDVSAGQISNGDDIGQGPDATTATFTQTDAAGGRLQLAQANHVIDLHLTGTYTTANFALQSDGVHGTTVIFVPNASLAGHG